MTKKSDIQHHFEAEERESKTKLTHPHQARAAQKPKGKLGKELERQKAQTVGESLNEVAREERRRKEVDGMHAQRNFN